MEHKAAENVARGIIEKATDLFYENGVTPTCCEMDLVPFIEVAEDKSPNGNLTPVMGGIGMAVTSGLLAIKDSTAVKFAIGHELGHAFSETILSKIGLKGVGGSATEVIADLASAYILTQIGTDKSDILNAVANWQSYEIFDFGQSGDHPAGKDRQDYVEQLFKLMSSGQSFETCALKICKPLAK